LRIGRRRSVGFEDYAVACCLSVGGLQEYLREVLNRIGEHPINAIDALLPWNIFPAATLSVAA
jgi:hypothetical protein